MEVMRKKHSRMLFLLSTIRTDTEVQTSTQDVPEEQTAMYPLLSTQVHGIPTATTMYCGPTMRDDFGSDDDFGITGMVEMITVWMKMMKLEVWLMIQTLVLVHLVCNKLKMFTRNWGRGK